MNILRGSVGLLGRSSEGGGLWTVGHIAGDSGGGPGIGVTGGGGRGTGVTGSHVLLGDHSVEDRSIGNSSQGKDDSVGELHFERFAEAIDFGK